MNVIRKALSILIVAGGASAPALAQDSATALGGGLTLPLAGELSAGRADALPRLGGSQTGWWSLAGAEQRRFDIGLSVAPRPGLRSPLYSSNAAGWGVDIGPGLRWRSAAGTLTATYGLDPTGLSGGERVQFNFSRPVISEQGFRMLAFVGAQWQTGRADRVVPGAIERWTQPVEVRPLYSTGATTNVGFGLDSYYQLTKSSAIMVGASGLRLGGAPADGALYTNRWQAILYGGYAIQF